MNSFEFNKIFAAILVAGIVAMLGGFIAERLVHPEHLEKDVVFVQSAVAATGADKASKPQGPEPVMHLIAGADIERGKKISKACAACHSFNKGGPNKVGPNLWGVVGAPRARKDGYAYSAAMKSAGGTWDYTALNAFLWKPRKTVPGTKMTYAGLKKAEDRAAIIAWLRTLSDSPKPLPSEADMTQEQPEPAATPAAEEGAAH